MNKQELFIKIELTKRAKSQNDIANIFKCSKTNVNKKIKRGTFSFEELQTIAEAWGCDFVYYFKDREAGSSGIDNEIKGK